MKKLRRILAILLVVLVLLTLFTACSKTGKCDLCHKEAKLKKLTIDGETAWLCDSCYQLMKSLGA